jgi:hypothetical protein
MTNEEIWDWQCKMHLWSCWLYEIDHDPALDDYGYDQLCQLLLRSYGKLPGWFTQRVTKSDLRTGTASGVAQTLTPKRSPPPSGGAMSTYQPCERKLMSAALQLRENEMELAARERGAARVRK